MRRLKTINGFDIDGVISIGIHPGPDDVIITGRSFEESKETLEMLRGRGINNKVFFNPLKYDDKTRESSGDHKASVINGLLDQGIKIEKFFEDDEIQKAKIEENTQVAVIHVVHDLTNKENQRHLNEK